MNFIWIFAIIAVIIIIVIAIYMYRSAKKKPSEEPSKKPSEEPSKKPSEEPSKKPSEKPTTPSKPKGPTSEEIRAAAYDRFKFVTHIGKVVAHDKIEFDRQVAGSSEEYRAYSYGCNEMPKGRFFDLLAHSINVSTNGKFNNIAIARFGQRNIDMLSYRFNNFITGFDFEKAKQLKGGLRCFDFPRMFCGDFENHIFDIYTVNYN